MRTSSVWRLERPLRTYLQNGAALRKMRILESAAPILERRFEINQPGSTRSETPSEYLNSVTVEDAQAIRRLGHVEGLKQGLRPHFRAGQIRNNLGDPVESCMRAVTRAYPIKLNSDLHWRVWCRIGLCWNWAE